MARKKRNVNIYVSISLQSIEIIDIEIKKIINQNINNTENTGIIYTNNLSESNIIEIFDNLLQNEKINSIYVIGNNVRYKNRRILFDIARKNQNNINIQFTAYDIYTNLLDVFNQYEQKDLNKIKTMISEIDYPSIGNKEKWSYIYEINNSFAINVNEYNKNIQDFLLIEDENNVDYFFEQLKQKDKYLYEMQYIEQDGIYHKENVEEHITLILKEILIDFNKGIFDSYTKNILLLLALFHDIGKIFTKMSRSDILLSKGYIKQDKNIFISKTGESKQILNPDRIQFGGHAQVSGYIYNKEYKKVLKTLKNIVNDEDIIMISDIIDEHLYFHGLSRDNGNQKKSLSNFQYNKTIKLKTLDKKYKDEFVFENHPILNIKYIKKEKDIIDHYINMGILFSYYDSKGRIT